MDNSIKPSTPDPSAGEWQLALWPADWGGWSRATALLAGVPATVLAALWTPSAVWGLPEPDQSRYPELSFTGALVGHSSDVAAQTCPRYENEPDIREGDILALRIERTAGQWPYEQTIPVDFEILTGSTADAADLGNRKTLQKVSLRFRSAERFKAIQCHHVDIAKDLKLEGEELLSLRLKPKLGSYRVKSGADRRTISIAEEGAGILVRYGDETLGSVSSQRDFTVRLEAGALPSSLPTGGRSCSLQVDTSFSRTIDMDWRVRPGKDPRYGAASLADFTLPSRVTFNQGVAEIKVSARMDGDTVAEDFKLDRAPQGQEYPALLNLCEPASVSVPSGVLSAAVFGVIAPAAVAPSKPTGLGATASEDQVNLAWTQSDDGTITGWRYRLRIKGASSWGSAVDMDSSTSSTKSHTVNTSSHFDGIVTEFQVQSYNEVGDSPWSEAATATVLKFNNDKPLLSISKQGVTVKEGETETWTVKLNGALAGTVRFSELERTHAGAIRLSPAALTFTEANYNQPQTVTVTGVDAGSEVFNGKRTGEVVVNHAFFIPAGSSTPTVAKGGTVEVMVIGEPYPPAKPTGLEASASEDRVNLAWTASEDETITGWRYRLRIKGASSWGSAVDMDSSTSSTSSHTVDTSSHFDGIVTEFQVQSYNEIGASPWSDAAATTLINNDNPLLSISKQGVTVKEGETETWTVKLNGALAGTVSFDELERTHAGAIRLSPTLTFTEANYNQAQTVTVTGVDAGTEVLNGKRTGEVVMNHAFTLAGSPTFPTMAKGGSVAVTVEGDLISPPAAPKKFRARPDKDTGTVRLQWADPEDPSITKYEVRQRLAGRGNIDSWKGDEDSDGYQPWREIPNSGPNTTFHVVGDVTQGKKYLFQVRAVNAGGEGESSPTRGVTPMNVVTVTVDNGRLVEGDDGKKEMEFTVKLDGTPVEDVKVRVTGLATTSLHIGAKTGNGQDPQLPQTFGLATETGKGQDFVPLTQTIVFDAHGRKHRRQEGKNDLEQTVRIEVMGDRLAEDDEIFYLQLDNLQTKDTRVRLAGGGEKVTATGVIVDNDEAPVLAPLEDVTIMAGEEVDITASATDTDGDTITYTWTRKAGETTPALPQGTELNQARLTFTPSEGGTYTMTVTANDGHGNTATEDVTVTVSEPARILTLSGASTTVTEGDSGKQLVTVTVNLSEAAQATVQPVFSIDSTSTATQTTSLVLAGCTSPTTPADADICFSDSGLSPDAIGAGKSSVGWQFYVLGDARDEGDETVKLTVSAQNDNRYTAGAITITITDDDASPVLEGIDDVTVAAGEEVNITASATDADGDTIGYTWLWKGAEQAAGNQAQYTFTMPYPGEYFLTVTADDGHGNTDAEDVTITVKPAAPTGFKATEGNQKVKLTWTDPGYYGRVNITKYQIQKKEGDGAYGSWADIPGSSATTTSHTVTTGLTNGKRYRFKIRAVSGTVNGVESDEVSATPIGPVAPTLTVTMGDGSTCASTPPCNDLDAYSVDTAWTVVDTEEPRAMVEDAKRITGWTLQYRLNGGQWESIVINWKFGRGVLYKNDIPLRLENGTKVEFRVRAMGHDTWNNTIYGPWSDTVTKTAQSKHTPAALERLAAYGGNQQVLLRWVKPNNAHITGWQVQQDDGSWAPAATNSNTLPGTVSHTVTGLTNYTTYRFKVRAVAGAVAGDASREVTATPKGVTAPTLSARATKNSDSSTYSATLTWVVVDQSPHAIVENAEAIRQWFMYERDKGESNWQARPIPMHRISSLRMDDGIWSYKFALSGSSGAKEYRVRAQGVSVNTLISGDASYSNIALLTWGIVPKPEVSASGGNQQVNLRWRDPGNPDITKWQVQQDDGSWVDISGSNAKTINHTVTGLTNGRLYRFKIRAVAGAAEGPASDEVSVTPKAVTAPTLTVTTQDKANCACYSSHLSWTVADTTPHALVENADRIVGWTVHYRRKGAIRWEGFPISTSTAATRSYTHNARRGTEMEYRVRANGAQGNLVGVVYGPWSNTVSVIPTPAPEPPTGVKAYGGNQQVTLRWNPSESTSITKYQYEQNGNGTWVDIPGSNAETVSHTVKRLTNGTSYRFKVRAVAGTMTEGEVSNEVSATPKAPVAPTLTARAEPTHGSSNHSVFLNWTVTDTDPHAIAEHADEIDGWHFEYRRKGATSWEGGGHIYTSNGKTRTYTHSLAAGSGPQVEYRVKAYGQRGPGPTWDTIQGPWSNIVTVTLVAKPAGFHSYGGNQQVLLRWGNPNNAHITKYQVRKKESGGAYGSWTDASIDRTTPAALDHVVTGLTNGTSYRFQVRAVVTVDGQDIYSEESDDTSATPKGVTAPTLSATVTKNSSDSSTYSANLTWTVADTDPHAIVENAELITEWELSYRDKGDETWTGVKIPNSDAGTRSYNHPLSSSGEREYRVRAIGSLQYTTISGEASYSNAVPLQWGAPEPPTGFTAQAGDGKAILSWDDPGEEYITDYEVRRKEKGKNWGTWASVKDNEAYVKVPSDGETISYTVSGLTNGTEYTFEIRTVRGADQSQSVSATVTPTKATPGTADETLPSNVPPAPTVKIDTGNHSRRAKICTSAEPRCDYRTGGAWKSVWSIDLGAEGAKHYTANGPVTALQIQYARSDRPQDGVSGWINTGWGPGEAYDGYISSPWPGMVSNRRRFWWGFIYYEQVPYEISLRLRLVNANGAGEATGWYTFTPGVGSYPEEQTYLPGSQQVSVSDAMVKEAEGAELSFRVTLGLAQAGVVNVKYATRDVTATAGEDYTATSGTLTFAPGETEKVVKVAVLDDSHDEASETMELVLSEIGGPLYPTTALSDVKGTGTIKNTDPMPAAWLGRFGRTVADQALDAISDRIAAERTPGLSGSLAGQNLPPMPFGSGGEVVSDASGDTAEALAETIYHAATASGSMSGQDVLLGTSFSLARGADATGGNLSFWGSAAYSGFDGKEGNLSLDGEVLTGLLGMDYSRQRWMLGLAVSHSGGNGSYNGSGAGATEGKIEASLTAGVPYGAWQATEWLELWGALGYGRGQMTLKPKEQDEIKADLNWTMAAVGARAALLDPDGEGLSLDLLSDALWTRTTSEKAKVGSMAATEADVTRLRLALEGSWANLLQGGGELTPKFSLGARYDGGDAETGFGMELGGGVVWSSPGAGLSLDLDGRTLLFHEADGLKDWGFSAGLVFDPNPDSERGLSVTLGQDWGGEATGGIDALFAANPLEQRSGVEGTSRWTLEASYGLPAFAGRFTGAPYVGLALAAGARDYTVGWRLTPESTERDITFEVKATRSEKEDASADHGVELDIRRTW